MAFDPDALDRRDSALIGALLPVFEAFNRAYLRLRVEGIEHLSAVPAVRAPGSTWLLLTTNAEFIERTPGLPDMGPPDPRRIIWTDDFSSLISVLR